MQSNVECRLHEEDVILKEPPLRGGKLRGRVGPPRTPLFKCGSSPNSRHISHLRIDYFGLMIDKKNEDDRFRILVKIAIFHNLLQKYIKRCYYEITFKRNISLYFRTDGQ